MILSYNLASGDADPWVGAREGMVYYAQNAVPILKTAIWIVILERYRRSGHQLRHSQRRT